MQVPRAEVTIYQAGYRFGMEKVITDSGLPEKMIEYIPAVEFQKIGKDDRYAIPDIVVSITCIKDTQSLRDTWVYLLKNHHTHFFCVFHHADQMENTKKAKINDKLSPFIRADRIDFVALSHHVAEYAQNTEFSKKWKVVQDELHRPPVRVFPPVFNFKSVHDFEPPKNGTGRERGFALQGAYDKGRDYPMVFENLIQFIKGAEERQESADGTNLHLVGFGVHPPVPDDLRDHVIFDERLDYTEFYNCLRQTDAVMTAFSSEEYYQVKASSTVPAALIAGTPLVGDRKLLKNYRYLDESVVWMQNDEESEIDTVGRVLRLSQEEKDAKRAAVRAWTENMVVQNHDNVRKWTEAAMAKFPADWHLS